MRAVQPGVPVGTVEPVPSRRGELWAFGGSCVEEVVLSSALKDRRFGRGPGGEVPRPREPRKLLSAWKWPRVWRTPQETARLAQGALQGQPERAWKGLRCAGVV